MRRDGARERDRGGPARDAATRAERPDLGQRRAASSGDLTRSQRETLARHGVDPSSLSPEVAQGLARSLDIAQRAEVASRGDRSALSANDGRQIRVEPTETVRGSVTESSLRVEGEDFEVTFTEKRDAATGSATYGLQYHDARGGHVSGSRASSAQSPSEDRVGERGLTASGPPNAERGPPQAGERAPSRQRAEEPAGAGGPSRGERAPGGQIERSPSSSRSEAREASPESPDDSGGDGSREEQIREALIPAVTHALREQLGDDLKRVSIQSYGPIREVWARVSVEDPVGPTAWKTGIVGRHDVDIRVGGVNLDTGQAFTDAELRSRDGEAEAEDGPVDWAFDLVDFVGLARGVTRAIVGRWARRAVGDEISAIGRLGNVRGGVEALDDAARAVDEVAESLRPGRDGDALLQSAADDLEPHPRLGDSMLGDDTTLELDLGPQPPRATEDLGGRWIEGPSEGPALRIDRSQRPATPGDLTPRDRFQRRPFQDTSTEPGGTDRGAGIHFHERNAAEIARDLRVDYDRMAGRPRGISYRVDADSRLGPATTDRAFRPDVSVGGAQARADSYTNTNWDRGHLVQRELFAGDAELERIADQTTTVVPMKPSLNRGAGSPWRAAERRTLELAREHGSVTVQVRPIYDAQPPRLPDGTPIPRAIERKVLAGDQVVDSGLFVNYE